MAEKCRSCEIYNDVNEEASFDQRIFANRLKIVLPQRTWAEKTVHRRETHRLFGKEKVPDTVVSNEGHAHSDLGHEKTHPC